jgi:exosortase/archaeosortase family protein
MAGVVAVTVNIGRAIFLAHLRFTRGEESFDASHDGVGHVAFAVGGFCLLILAKAFISRDGKKGVVRRRQTKLKSA